jgi:hypothetical protein
MEILSKALWWMGDLMLVCILWRLQRHRLVFRYPYFFGYVTSVFLSAMVRLSLGPPASHSYAVGYWTTEFVMAATGFGVTWEIYSHVLEPYRGVRKMARWVLAILFAMVVAKALAGIRVSPWLLARPTIIEMERDLRILQAILLLGMLGLIVHYSLPIGRNIRAMLTGYGFFLGCAIITLTLRARWGEAFQREWDAVQRIGWFMVLAAWSLISWSDSREPVAESLIEDDYQHISRRTFRAMGQLRNHLTHSWRA